MNMKLLILLLVIIVAGCVPATSTPNKASKLKFNPATTTPPKNVPIASTEADKRFLAAYNILSNKCATCHTHKEPFSTMLTEDDWVYSGYIIRGDATNSNLLKKLKQQGGNMPPDGSSQLTAPEYSILKDWIQYSNEVKLELKILNPQIQASKNSGNLLINYTLSKALQKDIPLVLSPTNLTTLGDADYKISEYVLKAGSVNGSIVFSINPTKLASKNEVLEMQLSSTDIAINGVSKILITIKNDETIVKTPAQLRFESAKLAIDAKCMTCHTHKAEFEKLATEVDWVANNYYIRPGDADNSLLVKKITQQGGNMPPNGSVALTSAENTAIKEWIKGLVSNRPILSFEKINYTLNNSLNTTLRVNFTLSKALTTATNLNITLLSGTNLVEGTQFSLNKVVSLAAGATSGFFTINFVKDSYILGKKYINFKIADSQYLDVANNNVTVEVTTNATLKTEFQFTANEISVNKDSGEIKFLYTLPVAPTKDITITIAPTANSTLIASDYTVSNNIIKSGATSGYVSVLIKSASLAKTSELLELQTTSSDLTYLSSNYLVVKIKNEAVVVVSPALQRFNTAKAIIDAKCTTCHFHSEPFSKLLTEQDWINNNYFIKPGDATNSPLIKRTKLAGGNMPPTGSENLTTAEFESIKSWINGLASTNPILTLTKKLYDLSALTTELKVNFTLSKALPAATTLTIAVDPTSTLVDNTNFVVAKSIALAKDATSGTITISFMNIASISSSKKLQLNLSNANALSIADASVVINILSNSDDIILTDDTIYPLVAKKEYIYNKLISIFKDPNDANVKDTVKNYLSNYVEMFGDKCDPFEDPYNEFQIKQCVGTRLLGLSFSGKATVYKVLGDWEYNTMINERAPTVNVPRMAHSINMCESIINRSSAVTYSLAKAGLTTSSTVNAANLDKLYKVFNPGYALTNEEITGLTALGNWRDILRAYCIDPKWQIH